MQPGPRTYLITPDHQAVDIAIWKKIDNIALVILISKQRGLKFSQNIDFYVALIAKLIIDMIVFFLICLISQGN